MHRTLGAIAERRHQDPDRAIILAQDLLSKQLPQDKPQRVVNPSFPIPSMQPKQQGIPSRLQSGAMVVLWLLLLLMIEIISG